MSVGWYMYKQLPFEAAPAGNTYQRKIDEIFNDMPNIFGITNDILVVSYHDDGRDHNNTVQKVLQTCKRST